MIIQLNNYITKGFYQMKVITAEALESVEVKIRDEKFYKTAYVSEDDVFISYSKEKPQYDKKYNFVIVDHKYKRIDI